MASQLCFVFLFLLVTIAQILAVKAGTSINQAHLPCQPSCLGDLRLLLVLLLMRIFCKLICLEQSTFLRYICN
jgi:hypothetical protein